MATDSDKGLASLQRRLAEARENLRIIQERESAYVTSTDVPMQLIKDKRRWLDEIANLEQQVAAQPAKDSGRGLRRIAKVKGWEVLLLAILIGLTIFAIIFVYGQATDRSPVSSFKIVNKSFSEVAFRIINEQGEPCGSGYLSPGSTQMVELPPGDYIIELEFHTPGVSSTAQPAFPRIQLVLNEGQRLAINIPPTSMYKAVKSSAE
jgi:hypothetical protein